MADSTYFFLDGVTMAGTDSPASKVMPTLDSRNISFFFVMPAPSGAGSDTLDIVIQESDQEDFTDAERIRTLKSFTQATGNGGAVTEKLNVSTSENTAPYLRAKTTIGGTASVFVDVSVYAAYDTKV